MNVDTFAVWLPWVQPSLRGKALPPSRPKWEISPRDRAGISARDAVPRTIVRTDRVVSVVDGNGDQASY